MNENEETLLIGPAWAQIFFDILSSFCSIASLLAMIQRVNTLPVRNPDNLKKCDEDLKYKFEKFREVVKRIFFLIGEVDPTFTEVIVALSNMAFSINKYKYSTFAQLKQDLSKIKSEIDALQREMEHFIVDNELKKKDSVPADQLLNDLNAILKEWGTTPFTDVIVALKKINNDIFNMLHQ